jgi:hypothetical protein
LFFLFSISISLIFFQFSIFNLFFNFDSFSRKNHILVLFDLQQHAVVANVSTGHVLTSLSIISSSSSCAVAFCATSGIKGRQKLQFLLFGTFVTSMLVAASSSTALYKGTNARCLFYKVGFR